MAKDSTVKVSGWGGGNFKETMDVVTTKLKELAPKAGEKPYFFPDGVQLIQVKFNVQNLQGEFSLTVSGSAKALVEEGVASSTE